ncbi:MAG: hypothetical protein MR691_08185 [Clostridium sp.]|nr:hypothetical protein [Clostridium sp.]
MKTIILGCKNKYGYTIKQLKINYDNKTYKVGSFVIRADKIVTKKAINKKIEELKILGFEEE